MNIIEENWNSAELEKNTSQQPNKQMEENMGDAVF